MGQDYSLDDILNEYRDGEDRRPAPERPRIPEKNAGKKVPVRPAPQTPAPEKDSQAQRPASRKKKHPFRVFFLFLAVLIVGVLLAGIFVVNTPVIYPNVRADSVLLGCLTPEKAEEKLLSSGWEESRCRPLKVRTYCDTEMEIDPVQAGYALDVSAAVEKALQYGRSGGLGKNFKDLFLSLFRYTDITDFPLFPNNAYLNDCVEQCIGGVRSSFGEDLYYIDEPAKELVTVKGYNAFLLDREDLRKQIVSALENGEQELSYFPHIPDPVCPDFDAIHALVCTGPVNAAFADDGSHSLQEGKPGYEFDPVRAKELWGNAQLAESVRIPLAVTEPEVDAEHLKKYMFHDLLGAVTTKYNNSNENRSSNVRLAASKVDGIVLYPGEEFSFNDTVGVRTAEAGFLLAPAYAGYDDITEEIGGGVCQVSSGIYASALFASLEITAHTCHVYPPNYIQMGTDTTVSIPEGGGRSIDFKFRNNKSSPIKIKAYCEEVEDRGDGKPLKTVTVELWGTLEEDDYMPVEFDNSYPNVFDYDRVIEPAYPDREGYKLKFTHEENEFEDDYGKGLRTLTHRKVFDTYGNLVEDRIINRTYSAGYALDTYYYKK